MKLFHGCLKLFQLHWNCFSCIETVSIVFKLFQLYWSCFNCIEAVSIVLKLFQLYWNCFNCTETVSIVMKLFQLYWNCFNCTETVSIVLKLFQLYIISSYIHSSLGVEFYSLFLVKTDELNTFLREYSVSESYIIVSSVHLFIDLSPVHQSPLVCTIITQLICKLKASSWPT